MSNPDIYWQKISAIGQIAGAVATFLAVAVSLWTSQRSTKPKLSIKVGERLIIGTSPWDDQVRVLMFSIANVGERTAHINGVGWRTGWLRFGPSYLRRKTAIQMVGSTGIGKEPPFEVLPAAEASCYALMQSVQDAAQNNVATPFFTRDWPFLGRRKTVVWGWVSTAEGYTFFAKLEPNAHEKISASEIDAATAEAA